MNERDSSLSSSSGDNVIPFDLERRRARRIEKDPIGKLDDYLFIRYFLARWSHPASVSHITTVMSRDFIADEDRTQMDQAHAERLVTLTEGIDISPDSHVQDEMSTAFNHARRHATTSQQIAALELLASTYFAGDAKGEPPEETATRRRQAMTILRAILADQTE